MQSLLDNLDPMNLYIVSARSILSIITVLVWYDSKRHGIKACILAQVQEGHDFYLALRVNRLDFYSYAPV